MCLWGVEISGPKKYISVYPGDVFAMDNGESVDHKVLIIKILFSKRYGHQEANYIYN